MEVPLAHLEKGLGGPFTCKSCGWGPLIISSKRKATCTEQTLRLGADHRDHQPHKAIGAKRKARDMLAACLS